MGSPSSLSQGFHCHTGHHENPHLPEVPEAWGTHSQLLPLSTGLCVISPDSGGTLPREYSACMPMARAGPTGPACATQEERGFACSPRAHHWHSQHRDQGSIPEAARGPHHPGEPLLGRGLTRPLLQAAVWQPWCVRSPQRPPRPCCGHRHWPAWGAAGAPPTYQQALEPGGRGRSLEDQASTP